MNEKEEISTALWKKGIVVSELVICIDCGWFGEFAALLSEDGYPDTNYEYCPDCMSDDIYEFDNLASLKELLIRKSAETKHKVLKRVANSLEFMNTEEK